MISNKNSRSGQSLVEIMIGLGIGAVLIGAASIAVAFMLRSSTASQNFQKGGQLASDLMDKVSSWSSANWQNIYGLTKGLSTQYFLNTSGTALFAVQGQEGMLDNDVTNGLVGEWKFDEDPTTTSTATYDSTVNGNIGTLTNGPTRASSTCEISNCLQFDGINSAVSVQNSLALNPGSFAFSHWIKTTSTSSQVYTIGNAGGSNGYRFGIGNGSVAFLIGDATSYTESICGNVTVNDNNWHFITGVFDRTNNKFNCYVDGSFIASVAIGSYPTMSVIAPSFGKPPCCVAFKGFLDDIRIYNRVLSATEVQNLYKSTIFTRYFSVENVCRTNDASSSISGTAPCGGSTVNDPSTQKLSVYTSWLPNNTGSPQIKITNYLTRWQNQAFVQADWSGGWGQDGPFTSPGRIYSTSTNIDIQSSPGSIKILNLTPP